MMRNQTELAIQDIVDGLRMWRLWLFLAWSDIRLRYRRTYFGPFWQTLTTGIFVGSLGFLYAKLFNISLHAFLPYFSAGYVSWLLISALISEGCQIFISEAPLIHQKKLPYTSHVFKMVVRNVIVYFHNLPIYLIVAVLFGDGFTFKMLLIFPALFVISLNAIWVAILLGIMCTRFRDVPNFILSLLTIVFFVTPIVWVPDLLLSRGAKLLFVNANPFHHFIEVLRLPMMGATPQALSIVVVLGVTVSGLISAFFCLRAYRRYIAYWL